MRLSTITWQACLLSIAMAAATGNEAQGSESSSSSSILNSPSATGTSSSVSQVPTAHLSSTDTASIDSSSTKTGSTRSHSSRVHTASPSPSSAVFAAGVSTTASTPYSQPSIANQWNGGDNGGVDAGAAGEQSGSFSIGTGAMVAIIIVVVVVALFGTASLVLWIAAKRRQLTMRQAIKRASRRLTGRGPKQNKAQHEGVARRTAVRFVGATPPLKQGERGAPPAYQAGHKRGLVVDVNEVEKGMGGQSPNKSEKPWQKVLAGKAPENTKSEGGFMSKLWGNGWK